jgi:hypothetical protein
MIDSEVLEDTGQDRSEAIRWIVSASPPGGGDQLLAGGVEGSEIGLVAACTLVDHRVELEVDEVIAFGEVNGERFSIGSCNEPIGEPGRQTPTQEIRRPRVEPVRVETVVGGDSARCDLQSLGERSSGDEGMAFAKRDDVNVACRARYDSESLETGSANDHEFVGNLKLSELFAQAA